MKTNLLLASAAAVSILALAACGGTEYDPNNDPLTRMYDSIEKADSMRMWGPPTAITFADASSEEFDDMRVTIEGYIGVGSSIYETESATNIQLWERPGQHKGNYMSVGINLGTGNNEMKRLPDDYRPSDLELKDDKGAEVHYGDKIRITGIYSKPYTEGDFGSLDIQSFEKVDATPLDYSTLGATKVTTDTNNHASLEDKLVVAEGYLEIPSMVYITETVYFDLYETKNADEYITVDIMIGNGPNMVEDLPDNYGQDDIKIHDHKDMVVGKKKVRVYGVWKYDRIAAEYIEIL
jgi:hypothetical protein